MDAATEPSDRRELPAYESAEAARYLRMPVSTLRSWFRGQDRFHAVLEAAQLDPTLSLSFLNLVETHVLNAIRREHEIPLQRVRIALQTARDILPDSKHPLIDQRFETDGIDLFVRKFGEIVNLSRPRQRVMREVLSQHLHRIEWSSDLLPLRLYPFSGTNVLEDRHTIVIDPRISFGRRVIAGTGISTQIVFERYAAGETIDSLAADYQRERIEIEDAVRAELEPSAA